MKAGWTALALAAALLPATAQELVFVTGKAAGPGGDVVGSGIGLDGAAWRALGRPDLSSTLAVLPGVQPNRSEPGQSLPTLRGIGTVTSASLLGTQQATTGVYLEDLPLTDPFGFVGTPDFSGFELARLQVLRGPQAVLYGSASLGGAVNVVLAQPRLGVDASVGRATLIVPQHGRPGLGVGAALERAVSLALALRLEAFAEQAGGVVDNLGTGQADADRGARQGVRLAGQWALAPAADLRWQLLHQTSRYDDTAASWPDAAARRSDAPSASWRRDRLSLARVEASAEIAPGLAFTAVSGWVDKQSESGLDFTASTGLLGTVVGPSLGLGPLPPLPLVRASTLRPTRSRALSQEWRLASSAAGGPQWLAGLFVQHTRYDNLSQTLAPGGAAAWGPAGALLPGDEVGLLQVHALSREAALFGEAVWPLAPGLQLSTGARVYRASLAYDATLRVFGEATTGAPAAADRGVMPRLRLQHEGEAGAVYALVSRGYRVGGVNFDAPAFTPYRSDRLLNHEVGAQLRPAPGVRVDLALFQMDWRDAQVSALVTEPLPLIGVANVGQARSRGLEAALTAPLTVATQAGVRLAWTDAVTRAPFTTAAGQPVAAGARLPGTPRWQLAADFMHTLALPGGWAGEARADVAARGLRTDAIGSSAASPGDVQLGLGLSARRGPWQWLLRMDNAGDSAGVAGVEVVDRPGLAPLTYRYLTEPRRWSVNLRHEH